MCGINIHNIINEKTSCTLNLEPTVFTDVWILVGTS